MTPRIVRTGQNNINPPAPLTPWQAERMRGPLHRERNGWFARLLRRGRGR